MITSLPTVKTPTLSIPQQLYLALNDKAVRALISHESEDGTKQPIYYMSRAFRDTETHYPRVEHTCPSLIYAMQKLQHYLLAHMVHLMTKSNPIRTLL